jgi:outer membrane lipoprotein-sorting protein
MNFSRKFFLLLPALFLSVMTFAQPADPNYDPKAKAILEEVSKTTKAYSSITATFSITVKQANGTSDVKNGTVIMKGGMYKIVIENKVKDVIKKEEYYNDGTTTWVYSEKDKEVTIDNAPDPAKKKSETITPNDIFTLYEKGFKYTFVKEETQNGKVVQIINLFPEKPDKKNYHTVKVTIDKTKKQIINVVFMNKDGSTTTYNVKTFTPNAVVSDATFKYDKKAHPADVQEIDMR